MVSQNQTKEIEQWAIERSCVPNAVGEAKLGAGAAMALGVNSEYPAVNNTGKNVRYVGEAVTAPAPTVMAGERLPWLSRRPFETGESTYEKRVTSIWAMVMATILIVTIVGLAVVSIFQPGPVAQWAFKIGDTEAKGSHVLFGFAVILFFIFWRVWPAFQSAIFAIRRLAANLLRSRRKTI